MARCLIETFFKKILLTQFNGRKWEQPYTRACRIKAFRLDADKKEKVAFIIDGVHLHLYF